VIFNTDSPERLGHPVNEYRGNDFSGMEFEDCAFRGGVGLNEQVLPSRRDYLLVPDARGAVVRARAEVALCESDTRREEALALLRLFVEDVDRGQEQLFLRPADYAPYDDLKRLASYSRSSLRGR
jgi:hypothetical protein